MTSGKRRGAGNMLVGRWGQRMLTDGGEQDAEGTGEG